MKKLFTYTLHPFQFFVIAVICILIIFLMYINFQISLMFSLALFLGIVFYIYADDIDEKKFISIFLFVYPFLPALAGFPLGGGLPVMRAHRMITLVLLVYLFRKGLLFKVYKDFFNSRYFTYYVLFNILSFFITVLLSPSFGKSLNFFFSFILEFLIIGVVVFSIFRTREDIEKLVKLFTYSTLILVVLGIFEWLLEYNIFSIFGVYDPEQYSVDLMYRVGEIRVRTSFSHPIAYGSFIALMLPFILYYFRKNMYKFIAVSGIIVLALVNTQSRGSQVIALIVFAAYFIFVDRHSKFIYFLMVLPILIRFHGTILYQLRILNPFFSGDQVLQESSMARIDQVTFLWPYIKKNLLFGYGSANVPARMRWIGNYHPTVDSFLLLSFFIFGIVGVATMIVLSFVVLYKPISLFQRDIFKDKLLLLLLAGVIGFYVINLVVALWSFHYIFWIYVGLIARLMVIRNNEMI